jgi:hypothetical protein
MTLFKPPAQRRLVLVLDDSSYAGLSGRDLAQLESGHDLQVVSLLDVHSATDDPIATGLLDGGVLQGGALLAQNPMRTNIYLELDGADKVVARDKAQLFALLCQYLGAKNVTFKHSFHSSESVTRTGTSGISAGPVSGTGKVSRSMQEIDRALQSVSTTFSGSQPDLDAARRLLRSHHLDRDTDVAGLVAMVEHASNPVRKHVVKMSVNRELVRNLEVVAELRASKVLPPKVSARYESTVKSRDEIEAEYTVTF